MIFNAALDKAYSNYRAKYDTMVAEALENQSDDVKSVVCSMMAYDKDSVTCSTDEEGNTICTSENSFNDLFNGLFGSQQGGPTNDGTSYVIKTADLSKKLELMSHNSGKIVLLDNYDVMISLISMKAFYNPRSNICTITTTTSNCLSEKEIVYLSEADFVKDKKYEDGTTKKYWCDDCEYKYEGVLCDKYSDPVEKVTEIQM